MLTDTPLTHFYASLKSTRRGKHIYQYSYYHVALIDNLPHLSAELTNIRIGLDLDKEPFNVVKLNAGHRIYHEEKLLHWTTVQK